MAHRRDLSRRRRGRPGGGARPRRPSPRPPPAAPRARARVGRARPSLRPGPARRPRREAGRVRLGPLGGAEAALEAGVQFAIEHEEFGGPIALKQAIQNFIADTAAEIESLRCLVYHTAWLADTGEPYSRDASIAKLVGSEIAMRAANKMLQVHGGFGYMKEYAIERMYRDFRALRIVEGTSEIQRFIIARDILKEKGLAIRP